MWQCIRQAAPTRNIPQVVTIFTLVGLLCSNMRAQVELKILPVALVNCLAVLIVNAAEIVLLSSAD